MTDEAEIIRRVKKGDAQSYALLVEKYHRPLLTFIFRLVGDEDVVEDIGQDVFFSVYTAMARYDEKRGVPFSAWLFTAARNRSISFLREQANRRHVDLEEAAFLDDGGNDPEQTLLKREQMEALAASLQQIPEPFRKTIMLSLEDTSLGEIALHQGTNIGTVKSRLTRAKDRVKRAFAAYFEVSMKPAE